MDKLKQAGKQVIIANRLKGPLPLEKKASSLMDGYAGLAPKRYAAAKSTKNLHTESEHGPQCPGKQYIKSPPIAEKMTINTSKGAVEGFARVKDGPVTFRGIPYGAPTSGANRWKGPQPVTPWQGTMDCTVYGEAVAQNEVAMSKGLGGAPKGGDIGKMGDKCLNINVVTPSASGSAPVMVWIHGGSNCMGSNKGDHVGVSPTFGDEWAKRGVVACAVNYRMALHGFMHMPEYGVTNIAIRDLIGALEWVKAEIAAFGGDPNNVTIFGQSAGGINIASLLCSPPAKGLFQKAIVQSGGISLMSPADYTKYVYPDYQRICTPFLQPGESWSQEALNGFTGEDLYSASTRYKTALLSKEGLAKSPLDYHTITDGEIIAADPMKYLRDGGCKDVTVMIGAGAHEANMMKVFMGGVIAGMIMFPMLTGMGVRAQANFGKTQERLMPKGALKKISKSFKANIKPLLKETSTCTGAGQGDASAMSVSYVFGCGGAACIGLMEALLQAGGTVLTYEIDLPKEVSPKWGNGHCVDLPLLFMPASKGEQAFVSKVFFGKEEPPPGVMKISENMCAAWSDFAKAGSDGLRFGGVEWPSDKCMTIGPHPAASDVAPFDKKSGWYKAWKNALESNGFKEAMVGSPVDLSPLQQM